MKKSASCPGAGLGMAHLLRVFIVGGAVMSRDIVWVYVCLTVVWMIFVWGEGYVVVLLFYVHGKYLWSCRGGQLTYPHFSWTGLLTSI